jgi:O-acetylhomoserine/O-acetylserine sulfhydrylase-like pyridoxal-dependent enzyme
MNNTKETAQWKNSGAEMAQNRQEHIERTRKWKFDTIATHGLYGLEQALNSNNGSIMEPVYMSPAQAFQDYDHMQVAMAYEMPSWAYTRIANPSTSFFEDTVALLEAYGTGLDTFCVACGSGMAAIRTAIEPFLIDDKSLPKPNFVSTACVYGGTFQQFSVRQMQEKGIEVRWVKDASNLDEWAEKIDGGTRFLFGEMPSNPAVALFDIEKVAELAHQNDVPLIVDATCASPALMRPLAFGADIVVQSASKVMASNGTSIVGTVTAKMNIPSRVGCDQMRENFGAYVKLLPYRDNGPALSPMSAILALNDLRSLRSRVAQMSRSSQKIAEFLESHPKIKSVYYPGLASHPQAVLAKKYLTLVDSEHDTGQAENCYGYMMSFEVCELDAYEPENTRTFYDKLNMIWRATDLGRVKTVATIPAISTHQQQGDEGRDLAAIKPNHVRLSIGIEHADDIIDDLTQALDAIVLDQETSRIEDEKEAAVCY